MVIKLLERVKKLDLFQGFQCGHGVGGGKQVFWGARISVSKQCIPRGLGEVPDCQFVFHLCL